MTRFLLYGVIALSLLLGYAEAKKLYKYQDANGRWHYTDRRPQNVDNVEESQLRITQRTRKVSVVRRGVGSAPTFYIINEMRGPIELELSLERADNVSSFPKLPKRFVVPGASEIRAAVLQPIEKHLSWAYAPRYRYMPGDPSARHRPPHPYQPPFTRGRSFLITQAFNGQFSHNHPQSQYAVDIAMPEGSKVRAARAGVVMDMANDFIHGGPDIDKFLSRANMIRIVHDDGTMAVYAHLRLESAQVAPGVRVETGQWIAESGNTGFSTGPHLHFVIQKNTGMNLISIPFEFAAEDGRGIEPKADMILTSY